MRRVEHGLPEQCPLSRRSLLATHLSSRSRTVLYCPLSQCSIVLEDLSYLLKTTLGRPSRQRPSLPQASSSENNALSSAQQQLEIGDDDDDSLDVEDFILTQVDQDLVGRHPHQKPSKAEMCDALISPFALFTSLLSRDRRFARALKVPPAAKLRVSDVVNV